MKRILRNALTAALWLCAAALLIPAQGASAQEEPERTYESKFADTGDVRLQYMGFGGSGLPVLFIHAADRGASTWEDFAPRFTDRHWVLAITARGIGESEGEPAGAATRAGDILGFLDALAIERAVFIGNSSPAQDMTYLAEHHPDRVAGLVYLANAPPLEGVEERDPTGALEMVFRATDNVSPHPYRPEYLGAPDAEIDVPALTFVAQTGSRGWENLNLPLIVAGRVAESGADWVADPEARAFFERLASDEGLQEQVRLAWDGTVAPAVRENEEAFQRAFGDDLRVIELDVPFVTGYEYTSAPDLVEPHIRRFLGEVRSRSGSR